MKLEKIIIGKSGVSEMIISEEDRNYDVKINKDNLEVSKSRGGAYNSNGGMYNRINDETTWYLRHCCGSHGFGEDLDDSCASCDNDGETTDETTGIYSGNRNLTNIISYSLKMEKEINRVFDNSELDFKECIK